MILILNILYSRFLNSQKWCITGILYNLMAQVISMTGKKRQMYLYFPRQ